MSVRENRHPIACCLKEGGQWTSQKGLAEIGLGCWIAPIRLYADGSIEDDIFQKAMSRASPYRNRLAHSELQAIKRDLRL